MSGWIFLAIGALVGIGDFLVGQRFTRLTAEQLERNPGGSIRSVEPIHRLGRLLMIAAPVFFLLLAAIACGLIPLDSVEPIRLGGAS